MKFEYSPYIALQVKDHEKAIDFYKRVLGMEFIEESGNDIYLKKDSITFVFENNPDGAHKNVFFEFHVESVKEAREILEREGCSILEEYNDKSVMFSDPYGMRFHVWEEGAFADSPQPPAS